MNSTIFQKQPKLSLSVCHNNLNRRSAIENKRSPFVNPDEMADFSNPLFGNETPGITKTIDRYLTGSRIRDRWIGSSSRCDNATVKLSRGRKILSQFKFHREDDPLQVSG